MAVLLDGAGTPGGSDTGCEHGVAWYARTLGGLVLAAAREPAVPLTDALADGIEQVRLMHVSSCDLGHPGTPSATVLVARAHDDVLEYLVLADSVLLLQVRAGGPEVITDNRLEAAGDALRPDYSKLAAGSCEREAARQRYITQLNGLRNQPGGFWVAAADPAVASEALTGVAALPDLAAVALLSDGAGRLPDRYHQATWPQVAEMLAEHGPAEVIRRLRDVERTDPLGRTWPRSKLKDDATIVYWRFGPATAPEGEIGPG